jgi:hypothetical protein
LRKQITQKMRAKMKDEWGVVWELEGRIIKRWNCIL